MPDKYLLTSKVSAAASTATIPGEMPGLAASIAIALTVDVRALAPELSGTVTTLQPRLFSLDSFEKHRRLFGNYGSNRVA